MKGFKKSDIVRRYLNWYKGPPHDTETAFDTGYTFTSIFSKVESTALDPKTFALEFAKSNKNAGINSAHRQTLFFFKFFFKKEISLGIVFYQCSPL